MSRMLILAASLALVSAAAQAADDKDFLSQAIKGDNSEISLGNLAADQGGSTGVKTYGKTLVADHSNHKRQASALAKQLGVAPPAEGTPDAKEEYSKLRAMKGEEFDREFVNHMIMDHQKDIAEYKEQAKGNSEVAKMAAQTVPVLEKHLQLAEGLKGKP